jgi:archaemetzincin
MEPPASDPPEEGGRPPIEEVRFLPVAAPLADLPALVAAVSRRLAVPCRLIPEIPGLDLRELAGRNQLDADPFLASLSAHFDDPTRPVVAVTDRDLGLRIFTFVFGWAEVRGKAALVSLARLRPEFYGEPPDPALFGRRAVAEILHELGHVFGLEHCRDANCLMHFSNRIEAVDIRGIELCETCQGRLGQPFERNSGAVGGGY